MVVMGGVVFEALSEFGSERFSHPESKTKDFHRFFHPRVTVLRKAPENLVPSVFEN